MSRHCRTGTKCLSGNILFAHDNLSDNGILILKNAPGSNVQLAYPGGDFITEFGKISAIGVGLNPDDLDSQGLETGLWFCNRCIFGC